MLVNEYSDFSVATPGCVPGSPIYRAQFKLDSDVTDLFPYINAVGEDTIYYDKPLNIQFTLDGIRCAIYPDEVTAVPFGDREQAREFIARLIDFLNDIHGRKDSIEPDHNKFNPVPVLDIFKLLPGTNCKECGFPTCMAFATALSGGDSFLDKCPQLNNPADENTARLISML